MHLIRREKMAKKIDDAYDTSTGSVITLEWSKMGDVAARQRRFGGYINSWGAERIGEHVYLIPESVTVEKIHTALTESLKPSDRAVVAYPHGKTRQGSSAMRVRLYGKAVGDRSP